MVTMFIILLSFIIIYLLIIFYLTKNIHKLEFIKNIKNNFLSWIISFIPFIIIFILFNYINSFIIIFHFFLFLLLAKLIVKMTKKNSMSLSLFIAISFTLLYLGIGIYNAYHIQKTHYEITTEKKLGQDNFRIIQISDAHIGTTFNGDGFRKQMEKISKIESNIVVITGDFVDDDTTKEDMIKSCQAFRLLKPKNGIYFVYGNHDKGYYQYRDFTVKELKEELEKAGVHILEDDIVKINDYIYLIGRQDKSVKGRKNIVSLTKDLKKENYIIDLNHQPNDYQNEMNNVDLVLSGHTHGGQLFPLGYIGLLIGGNDEFYGLHKRGNTNFIVNSGISDWAVDFKTGTHSEYVVIDIKEA